MVSAADACGPSRVEFGTAAVEGHQRAVIEGTWNTETRDVEARAVFVPIAQPKARLVHALLEPKAPDSLAAWGVFNNRFEQKEYLEAYVAEDIAREMLARDPQLREAFDTRLRDDATFAADAQARVDFFARRHASWDRQFNLYPVSPRPLAMTAGADGFSRAARGALHIAPGRPCCARRVSPARAHDGVLQSWR